MTDTSAGRRRSEERPPSRSGGSRPLVVVSNRLPIEARRGEKGNLEVEAGAGGLVTAMAPVLRERGGRWIGWAGLVDGGEEEVENVLSRVSRREGYELRPVLLTRPELDGFYFGFSNEVLWPLFHDLQGQLNYDPAYWEAYRAVNRKYARVVLREAPDDAYVWVHDYHLLLVAHELREAGFEGDVGFFLHTPFPSPDVFEKLPWRRPVLRALLRYDLMGVQTARDLWNFAACVDRLVEGVEVPVGGGVSRVRYEKREVRVGTFPISIDVDEFTGLARSPQVEERTLEIREDHPDRKLIMGVDRLDYTKGIPYRLRAFQRFLEHHPESHGKVSLVQLVVPSREEIPAYGELKEEIERLVGEINGQFTRASWVPVHYLHRSVGRPELVALYRAASAALVTPLKDGMNLVSKEYCACNVDGGGVLVLSEFAGSAMQLGESAVVVNPYDIEGMAEAIHRALTMEADERTRRMERMRERIRKEDIFWWVDRFSRAADGEAVEPIEDSRPRGRRGAAGER